MICPKCSNAADLVDVIRNEHHVHLRAAGIIVAEKLHAQCRGGTWCDCAHRIDYGVLGSTSVR